MKALPAGKPYMNAKKETHPGLLFASLILWSGGLGDAAQPGGQVSQRPLRTWKCRWNTLCPACHSPPDIGPAGTPLHLKCSAEVNSACAKVLLRKTLVHRTATRPPWGRRLPGDQPGGQVISRPLSTWKCRWNTLCPACISPPDRCPVGTPLHLKCSAEVNSACAKVLLRKTLVRRTAARPPWGRRLPGDQPGGQVIARPLSTWKCR